MSQLQAINALYMQGKYTQFKKYAKVKKQELNIYDERKN
jgi:hypothetical protein